MASASAFELAGDGVWVIAVAGSALAGVVTLGQLAVVSLVIGATVGF
ncbi:hypothetical protein GCM10009821_01590 [Aeromicrobium halocynthiae]|uniref:Sulfite exporter TauE/SafE family protein n=1 Tax=Aeromicrobium halocynthiae TaxID=560557 RepID=A0ABN2VQT8_9ACTN